MTGDPGTMEGIQAGVGGGGVERNGVWPASSPVNYGEEVSAAIEGRKRANEVDVDVGERAVRDWNGLRQWGVVAVNLGTLTGKAGTAPGCDVISQVTPDIP